MNAQNAPSGYSILGADGTYIIVRDDSSAVVGAFYSQTEGWWRGHAYGRVKRLYMPGAAPADVAARLLGS